MADDVLIGKEDFVMKLNALGNFACSVRRELGNCEKYFQCEAKWDFDHNCFCNIDPFKLSNASIQDIIEIIRDKICNLPMPTQIEAINQFKEQCAEIDELFDWVELALAKVVGSVGIGQQPWVANMRESERACRNRKD